MKLYSFILTILLGLSTQLFGQSAFEIKAINYRYGPKALEYIKANNVEIANLMTQSSIIDPLNPKNDTTISLVNVEKYLLNNYPSLSVSGSLVLNWESKVFKNLRDYPPTDSRYKYAEGQWRALIQEIRKLRPRLKIGIYGISFKVWGSWQIVNYNTPGKYDNLLSLVDFIAPSVYIQFADEEVGHERNLQFLKDNLDIALTYGKRLSKPVYPFVWHRVHISNTTYGHELIQVDVMAKYIKYIANYSFNNFKSSGVYLWEEASQRSTPTDLSGVNNWLNGTVYNADTYDQLNIKYISAMFNVIQ